MPGAGDAGPPTPPGIVAAGIGGLCPRCGARTLYAGWIKFASRCRACGLDYTAYNVGDGPAAFLTLIVGTIVVAGAVILQLTLDPPFWVQALIWVPLTILMVLGLLRIAKAILIASEYRNRAGEGRLAARDDG